MNMFSCDSNFYSKANRNGEVIIDTVADALYE